MDEVNTKIVEHITVKIWEVYDEMSSKYDEQILSEFFLSLMNIITIIKQANEDIEKQGLLN